MITTQVYTATPMLGYNGKDIYTLSRYHVAPLKSLSHLTIEEAEMVAAFMNKLKDDRSIRAIENRVFMGRGVGFQKLFDCRGEDYLRLSVVKGAIVWTEGSVLEGYENETI